MKDKLKDTSSVLLGMLVLLVLNVIIIAGPFSIVWLVNYIFPVFSIPYSFLSWIMVTMINIGIFSAVVVKHFKEKI